MYVYIYIHIYIYIYIYTHIYRLTASECDIEERNAHELMKMRLLPPPPAEKGHVGAARRCILTHDCLRAISIGDS